MIHLSILSFPKIEDFDSMHGHEVIVFNKASNTVQTFKHGPRLVRNSEQDKDIHPYLFLSDN